MDTNHDDNPFAQQGAVMPGNQADQSQATAVAGFQNLQQQQQQHQPHQHQQQHTQPGQLQQQLHHSQHQHSQLFPPQQHPQLAGFQQHQPQPHHQHQHHQHHQQQVPQQQAQQPHQQQQHGQLHLLRTPAITSTPSHAEDSQGIGQLAWTQPASSTDQPQQQQEDTPAAGTTTSFPTTTTTQQQQQQPGMSTATNATAAQPHLLSSAAPQHMQNAMHHHHRQQQPQHHQHHHQQEQYPFQQQHQQYQQHQRLPQTSLPATTNLAAVSLAQLPSSTTSTSHTGAADLQVATPASSAAAPHAPTSTASTTAATTTTNTTPQATPAAPVSTAALSAAPPTATGEAATDADGLTQEQREQHMAAITMTNLRPAASAPQGMHRHQSGQARQQHGAGASQLDPNAAHSGAAGSQNSAQPGQLTVTMQPADPVNTMQRAAEAGDRIDIKEEQNAYADAANGSFGGHRRLKVEDALSYLDKVKAHFGNKPDVYNSFLNIMKDFKSQNINTPEVIKNVSELFKGHPELVVGFNTFLPPGYKIEIPDESKPGNILVQHPRKQLEFSHAIQYVNKIKTRFQSNSEVYKTFRKILDTYQKEQKTISEVYEQLAKLFENHIDLLEEFSQFLPEAIPAARAYKERQLQEAARQQKRKSEAQKGSHKAGSAAGGDASSSATATTGSSSAAAAATAATTTTGTAAAAEEEALQEEEQPSKKAKQEARAADVKKRSLSDYVLTNELQFFDRVKRLLQPRPVYKDFLRCLNLYSLKIISREELLQVASCFLVKHPYLLRALRHFLGLKEDGQPLDPHQHDIDLNTCLQVEVSYRRLPDEFQHAVCSGRANMDPALLETLNNRYVSFPSWTSEDNQFVTGKKTPNEDALFKAEDERFELDMLLATNQSTINALQMCFRECKAKLEDMVKAKVAAGKSKQEAEKEGKKEVPLDTERFGTSSKAIHHRSLKRLYGRHVKDVIKALASNPIDNLPIVVARLTQKQKEWKDVQFSWNREWKVVFDDNYLRALDQVGPTFKKKEVTDLKPKAIRQWFKEQSDARAKYLARVKEQQAEPEEEPSRPRYTFPHPEAAAIDAFVELFKAAMHKHADKACDKQLMLVAFNVVAGFSRGGDIAELVDTLCPPIAPFTEDGEEQQHHRQQHHQQQQQQQQQQKEEGVKVQGGTSPSSTSAGTTTAAGTGAMDTGDDATTSPAPGATAATSTTPTSTSTTDGNGSRNITSNGDASNASDTDALAAAAGGAGQGNPTAEEAIATPSAAAASASTDSSDKDQHTTASATEGSATGSNDSNTTGFKTANTKSRLPFELDLPEMPGRRKQSSRSFYASTKWAIAFVLFQTLYERVSLAKDLCNQIHEASTKPRSSLAHVDPAVALAVALEGDVPKDQYFEQFMACTKDLIASPSDQAAYEEAMRKMFTTYAYKLYSIERLLGYFFKQLYSVTQDHGCLHLLRLHQEYYNSESGQDSKYYKKALEYTEDRASLFKVTRNPKSVYVELLGDTDDTNDDDNSNFPVADSDWAAYIDSFLTYQPNVDILDTAPSQNLLNRAYRKAGYNDATATEGCIDVNKFTISFALNDYRMRFKPGGYDAFARLGANRKWSDAQHAAASANFHRKVDTKLQGSALTSAEDLFLNSNDSHAFTTTTVNGVSVRKCTASTTAAMDTADDSSAATAAAATTTAASSAQETSTGEPTTAALETAPAAQSTQPTTTPSTTA